MSGLRRAGRRCAAWLRPARAEAEMRREMEAHVALLAEELERGGQAPAAARRAARLRFGSEEAARERHREARGLPWLEQTGRDLRVAGRSLRRAPAFTLAAVLTLALGLGATMAVFAVVNSVLLEPLPYPHAEQLVALRQFAPGAGGMVGTADGLDLSESMFVTYAEDNRSFAAMGIWDAGKATLTGRGAPEQVPTVEVNGVLPVLAVPPLLGRWFGPPDHDTHHARTAILSYGFWQRKFGGAPGIVGRSVDVNGRARVVVGVMPRGFRVMDEDADLLLPLAWDRNALHAAGFGYKGLARLRPGATLASSDADLTRLLPVWMDSWRNCPKCDSRFYRSWRITPAVRPLKDSLVGGVSGMLWSVLGTVVLLMLIAAGNVTNLFLVRGEARQHELAVRAALGAGRGRIARQLLAESALLALAGGTLGVLLAQATVAWLRAHGPATLPRLDEIALDGRVLWVGCGLATAAALVAGLIPMWRRLGAGRRGAALTPALASESRSASGSRERRRLRRALSVAQVALALVLLVAAGLLMRSFAALLEVAPGFAAPESVQTLQIAVPPVPVRSDAAVMRLQNDILDRLAAIPGVQSVGMAQHVPMDGIPPDWDVVAKQGVPFTLGSSPPVRTFEYISPGYLRTMGTRLVAGRDFDWNDVYGLRHYVLISDNLARELWGGARAALGQQLSPSGPGAWKQVIGVVEDVRLEGADKPAPAVVYWPALTADLWGNATLAQPTADFVLRSGRAGTAALQAEVRRAVAAVDPELPIAGYRTMRQIEDRSRAVPSFTLVALGLAGAMALGLGLVGIYGVVAYDVAQRRREIGVRMALGASRSAVRRMFVRQGMVLAAVGAALGLVAAAGLTRALQSVLFGVSPLDPLTFTLAPLLLLLAVLAASYLPARSASRLEVGRVLRD